jgi:hypothetical protein
MLFSSFNIQHKKLYIIYLKILFKDVFSFSLNDNEEFMKLFLKYHIFEKLINHNKSIIWNNNEHSIFQKIVNQLKIHFKFILNSF